MVIIAGSSRSTNPVDAKCTSFRLDRTIGINETLGDNAILLDSEQAASVIIPVGQQVLINLNYRSTQCITTIAGAEITCLALARDNKHIAICAASDGGKDNQIVIAQYDRKKTAKILQSKSVTPIKSASFSRDSKLVVVAYANCIEVWEWANDKVVAKGGVPENQDVSKICCSPVSLDSGMPLITTSGKNHMRVWSVSSKDRISNKTIMASAEEEGTHFLDHVWIKSRGGGNRRLAAVVSSEQPTILLFTFSEPKHSTMPTVQETIKIPIAVIETGTIISCICSAGEGFIVGGDTGFVAVFQPDSEEVFSQVASTSTNLEDIHQSICSNGERALLCCKNRNLYTCCWESKNEEMHLNLNEIFSFHVGTIAALSMAKARPLMITAGKDKSVRVWNLTSNKCIAMEQFDEAPRDVSFHPGGHQALICFKDRVSMYCIVESGFKKLFDVHGKDCTKASFSNGGGKYAIAFGRKISTYLTYKPFIETQYNFHYHTAPITSIEWSSSDDYLFSTGMDGYLYIWNSNSGTRVENLVISVESGGSSILDFSVYSMKDEIKAILLLDNGSVVMASSKEEESKLLHSEKANCIRYSLGTLFVGLEGGAICVYKYDNDWFKYHSEFNFTSHNGVAVNCMCSDDDGGLVICHDDGNIFIASDRHNEPHESASLHNEVIFVCMDEYQTKLLQIQSLEQEISQMKLDNELCSIRQAKEQKEEVDRVNAEKEAIAKEHSESMSRYLSESKSTQEAHNQALTDMSSKHSDEVTKLENMYEDRLLKVSRDIDLLKQQMKAMTERHDEEIKAMTTQHEAEVAKAKQTLLDSEGKLKKDLAAASDEINRTEHMRQEMLTQQAEEYEQELSQQSLVSLKRLKQRQKTIDSVNMEVQSLKSKREQQSRTIKDLRSKMLYHQNENGEVSNKCNSLEDEIKRMKQVVAEKDRELKKSEETLDEMNCSRLHLEKELYLANSKIDELVRDRGPLEESLELQKKVELGVRKQLQEAQLENEALCRHSDLQEQNMKSKDAEIRTLKSTVRDSNRKLTTLEGELVHLSSISNDKTLKSEVKSTYQKFIKEEVASPTRPCRSNSMKENEGSPTPKTPLTPTKESQQALNKARLEVKSLKQSLSKRMSENTVLMQDCDDLRKQNSELKSELARIYSMNQDA